MHVYVYVYVYVHGNHEMRSHQHGAHTGRAQTHEAHPGDNTRVGWDGDEMISQHAFTSYHICSPVDSMVLARVLPVYMGMLLPRVTHVASESHTETCVSVSSCLHVVCVCGCMLVMMLVM